MTEPSAAVGSSTNTVPLPGAPTNNNNNTTNGQPGKRRHRSRGRGRGGGGGKGAQSEPSTSEHPQQQQQSQPQQSNASHRGRGRGRGRGRRRGQFGSRVTADSVPPPNPAPDANAGLQASTAVVPSLPADATLASRLAHSLIVQERECSICVCAITAKESIYSCPVCHAIDHLACIKDWAHRSLSDLRQRAQVQPQLVVQWRCPSCNSAFPPKDLPQQYRCFCGRQKNPRPNKAGTTPHSCGQSCSRKREHCDHPCGAFCHPGPCDPCGVLVTVACWCGQQRKDLKCADVRVQRTCGQTCGKPLLCGLHHCDQPCHPGDCGPCVLPRDKRCFCGQSLLHAEPCQQQQSQQPQQQRTQCYGADGQVWTGEYACATQSCGRPYDCRLHTCQQPSCHPHTSPALERCPRAPDRLLTCPCGATPQPPARDSCAAPILTCSAVCGAALQECEHACATKCHTGDHPPCTRPVTVVCRCGADKRELPCHEARSSEHTCKRICRAMRSCGKHECARPCCPLAFQEGFLTGGGKKGKKVSLADVQAIEAQDQDGWHACLLTCGKMLSCGRHVCPRQDHRGPCGPCLASEFSEVSCNCGGTVLMPPVPCGTQLNCTLPCARPPPGCGHPKVPHACHEDDVVCPPCTFLSDRPCACDKHLLVKNVRCSMPADKISCGTQCGSLLSCGAHRCRSVCHAGPCPPCAQRCGKPRKQCGHPHEAACHAPSACSTAVPCPAPVDVTCACGHLRQRALCGSSSARPESAANNFLACTEACAVKKRNSALAQALGISGDAPRLNRVPATYDQQTLAYYAHSPNWCEQIEAALGAVVRSTKPSHLFQPMKPEQRHVVKNLAQAYGMQSQSFDAEPRRCVHVIKTPESAAPINSLSDSYQPPPKQQPLVNRSASQAVAPTPPGQKWNALLLTAVFGHDHTSLAEALSSVLSFPFDLEWVHDEDVVLVPDFPSGQSEANVESGLRSARFAIVQVEDVRARDVLGCRVAADRKTVTWKESPREPSVRPASVWARPTATRQAAPAPAPAQVQSRWTTLGHVRDNWDEEE